MSFIESQDFALLKYFFWIKRIILAHCRKFRKQNPEKIESERKEKSEERIKITNNLLFIGYIFLLYKFFFLIETTRFFKICILLFFLLTPPLQLKLFTNVIFLKELFIYFWLRWVFVATCRLSLVAASGGYFLVRCTGFSLQWLLLLQSLCSRPSRA